MVKGLLFRLVSLIIALIAAFVLLELGCRILPLESAYINIPRVPNKVVGYTRPPGSEFPSEKTCYSLDGVRFNELGFRGPSPAQYGEQTIIILGDSYMEAREVPSEATTWGVLAKMLQRPVLNYSVAGYGTVTQLFAYREFAKSRKPKVVILFFYSGNDVKDNSCELARLYNEPLSQPCGLIEDGRILWNTKFHETGPAREEGWIKPLLRRYCVSCNVVYRFIKFDLLNKSEHGALDFLYNVYRTDIPDNWKEKWDQGWEITKKALVELKQDVESNGGSLLVVSIPHTLALAPNWREMLKEWSGLERLPDDLDMGLADKRLKEITDQNGITMIPLAPVFKGYMREHRLTDPYLWFFCDGHWNPVGHFIAANTVAGKILKQGLMELPEREKLIEQINSNMKLGPEEIMGKKAFGQIYNNEQYTGEIGGKIGSLNR